VPEYGTFSVAQHTFALILELVNKVGMHAESVRKGEWTASGKWSYALKPISELKDKKLGIVGFGKIGRQVAAIGEAFGMEIIYNNRSLVKWPKGKQLSMKELFKNSDVISLHCPLTKENTGFVNMELLSAMKPSALLINTARGALINEQDLAQALKGGKLAGAALDVLTAEPPPADHILVNAQNCLMTPHNAWLSVEARARLMQMTVENIRQFLNDSPRNVVKL
jgi:glycerate dehydrogenase